MRQESESIIDFFPLFVVVAVSVVVTARERNGVDITPFSCYYH